MKKLLFVTTLTISACSSAIIHAAAEAITKKEYESVLNQLKALYIPSQLSLDDKITIRDLVQYTNAELACRLAEKWGSADEKKAMHDIALHVVDLRKKLGVDPLDKDFGSTPLKFNYIDFVQIIVSMQNGGRPSPSDLIKLMALLEQFRLFIERDIKKTKIPA